MVPVGGTEPSTAMFASLSFARVGGRFLNGLRQRPHVAGRIKKPCIAFGPVEYRADGLSREAVPLFESHPFGSDKTCFPQLAQMLRNGWLRHVESLRQIRHGAIRFAKHLQHLSPRRMSDRSENLVRSNSRHAPFYIRFSL